MTRAELKDVLQMRDSLNEMRETVTLDARQEKLITDCERILNDFIRETLEFELLET